MLLIDAMKKYPLYQRPKLHPNRFFDKAWLLCHQENEVCAGKKAQSNSITIILGIYIFVGLGSALDIHPLLS
jgi:hypothetical protein